VAQMQIAFYKIGHVVRNF